MDSSSDTAKLLQQVRACTLCAPHLPVGARPVLQLHPAARILVVGQAPGVRVHNTGIPFNDASGDRLREWMGVSREVFYDPQRMAIIPMGLCYPGTGSAGDLPPATRGRSVTSLVQGWQEFAPALLPLPHPSPRNNLWLRRNPWFAEDVLPALKARVAQALASDTA